MSDKLVEIIIEKGIIGLFILIVGYWMSRYLEIDKQKRELSNKIKETTREKLLNNIEKQLMNFYYPIYFRLQKDNALWELSPQLSNNSDSLPNEVNELIEKDYILTNHREILNIIECNIHLIEIDKNLQENINQYIRHVAVYGILRNTKSLKSFNPIDFNAPYPENLEKIIKSRMNSLQKKNNELLSESISI